MNNTLHIWPLEPITNNDQIIHNARFELNNEKSFHLWFSLPFIKKNYLTEMADPFVIASIFYAMENSNKMFVHGKVSPSLLRNLEEFQGAWINWVPKVYKHIEIEASEEREIVPEIENKSIMAFSGGLDSCFTAYRHKNGHSGRQKQEIETAMLVHGFDIPLKDENTFKRTEDRISKITNSIGMELISIKTNFREMPGNWNIVHEAGIAASLVFFNKGYRCGIIPSSFSYDSFDLNIPWGSNPLTDSLLSSKSFEIFNDASMYNRTQKLELLLNWPQAMEHMRVCWQGENLDSNCCKCEKCIRAILSFYTLGIKPARCFPNEITLRQIENVIVPDMAILFEYRCMLWDAEKNAIKSDWVNSLRKCINRNERRLKGNGLLFKRIKQKIAARTRLKKLYNTLKPVNFYQETVK